MHEEVWEFVAENGLPYRVLISIPTGAPPTSGWPVLMLVDGNAVYATARDAMQVQASYAAGSNVGPGIVAAVGYPVDGPYDPLRRSWDLSPPPGRVYPPFQEGGPLVKTGGAAGFLDVIEKEVRPHLAEIAPVDLRRQTLFGHSFGGLFALYSLFTRPGRFQTYVAASPSISWEDETIGAARDAYLATCAEAPAARVLLSAGEYEGDRLPPFQRHRADAERRLTHLERIRTSAAATALRDALNSKSRGAVRATFEVFPGENHMSVLPVAVCRAVQAAFSLDIDVQFEP